MSLLVLVAMFTTVWMASTVDLPFQKLNWLSERQSLPQLRHYSLWKVNSARSFSMLWDTSDAFTHPLHIKVNCHCHLLFLKITSFHYSTLTLYMTKYTNSFDACIIFFMLHVYIALTLEKRNQSSFIVKYFKEQTSKCCSLKAENKNLSSL